MDARQIPYDELDASHAGQLGFSGFAAPPYLNTPGDMLSFVLESYKGQDPDNLAAFLEKVRPEFMPPGS